MSGNWQPGNEALLRVTVGREFWPSEGQVWVETKDHDQGLIVRATDLRPVPDGDAIERAARVLADLDGDGCFDRYDVEAEDDDGEDLESIGRWTDRARSLAAAGLLTVPVREPGRSEAEIKAEALREHRRRVVRYMPPGLVDRATVIADLEEWAARVSDTEGSD